MIATDKPDELLSYYQITDLTLTLSYSVFHISPELTSCSTSFVHLSNWCTD